MNLFDGKVAIDTREFGVYLTLNGDSVSVSIDLTENKVMTLVNQLLETIGFQSDFPVSLLRSLSELATVKLRDCDLDGVPYGCPINVNEADRNELAKFQVRSHILRQAVKQFDSILGSNLDVVSGKLGTVLDAEDLESFTCRGDDGESLASIKLNTEAYVSVNKEFIEEAHQWLRDNGYDAIIKPTVHHKTLSSSIKEHLKQGGVPPPEHLIPMFTKLNSKITKIF